MLKTFFCIAAIMAVSVIGISASAGEPVQMEYLDRGTVAVKTTGGVYLSWRLLGTEDYDTAFDVYRDGTRITTVSDSTNYTDGGGTAGSKYTVVPAGADASAGKAVTVNANSYFDIPIQLPASETITSPAGANVGTFPFSVSDCSTADLDGDGEYEIITKMVSSEHDVGSPGDGVQSLSGTVRFNAYKLDGTRMWEQDINLGKNVYSSAHTVQFLAYDFNLDGKAELICQTSLGSTDGQGRYVSHAAKTDVDIQAYTDDDNASAEYRGEWGPITQGEEFLTVFNGETGEAIDTIDFPTARVGNGASFGDESGNRSNRFTASVAYLDGKKPYAVYLRGYYFGKNGKQRCGISGTSFDGEKLSVDYRFDTEKGQPGYYDGAYQYVGNGNHNCAVADVDGDGKDEFLTGALCMEVKDDNSFKPRWCTFMEHGDALHLGDYDPSHTGMEFFTVHEDGGPNAITGTPINFGMSVIDADSGSIIKHWDSPKDNGRGIMANIGAGGYYQITSANGGSYRADGKDKFTAGDYGMSMNFRVFWDGDTYDELLDGVRLTYWNGSKMTREVLPTNESFGAVNGTKANPSLQADILGDWREEIIYPTIASKTGSTALRVFMTTHETDHKLYTLMHDRAYRMQVSSEQTAYNQPPHIGYYISENKDEYDYREYADYIKTVHDGKTEVRSSTLPDSYDVDVDITINFKDEEGNVLKEPVTDKSIINQTYYAPDAYLADFGYRDNMCWRYKSGNDGLDTGNDPDASFEIDLVFSWVEAEISYEINAVDEQGNTIKTLKSGKARPGTETVTCFGDYGIIADGSCYVLADTSKNSVSFSPSADDKTRGITYKKVAGSGKEWDFEDGKTVFAPLNSHMVISNTSGGILTSAVNGAKAEKLVVGSDSSGASANDKNGLEGLGVANLDLSGYSENKTAISFDSYIVGSGRMMLSLLNTGLAGNWDEGWFQIGWTKRSNVETYYIQRDAYPGCADKWVHVSYNVDFGEKKIDYTITDSETGADIASGTVNKSLSPNALNSLTFVSWTNGATAYMDNISVVNYDENAAVPTVSPTAPPTTSPTSSPTAPPTVSPAASPTPSAPPAVEIPKFNIENRIGGKDVSITTGTDGAEIHYTTDGSVPTADSELYVSPIRLTESKVIKAIAVKEGMSNSIAASASVTVNKTEAPVSSHRDTENVPIGTVITLNSKTDGAMIYYTDDGTDPAYEETGSTKRYNGSIVIDRDMVIKAVAVRLGDLPSDIYEISYSVSRPVRPETVTVSVGTATAKAGDEIALPVYLFADENASYTSFIMRFKYNEEVFNFSGPAVGDHLDKTPLSGSSGGMTEVSLPTCSITPNGELFTLNFKAEASALDNDYPVEIEYVQLNGDDSINVEKINGTITLKGSVNSNLSASIDSTAVTDADGNTIDEDSDISGDVVANVTVDGVEGMPENQTSVKTNIILAVYGKNGSLITVSQSEADLTDATSVFSAAVSIPEGADVGSVKLMIWNSLSDMAPIVPVTSLISRT